MELAQIVVRHHREKMMRQVVVVADRKHRHADERIDQKNARVGEAFLVRIAMLHDLAQDHEKGERCPQRHQPQDDDKIATRALPVSSVAQAMPQATSVLKVKRRHTPQRAGDVAFDGVVLEPGLRHQRENGQHPQQQDSREPRQQGPLLR